MSAEDDPPSLDLRPLPGSERPSMPGVTAPATPLPAGVPIEVTVVVRRRAGAPTPNAATVLTPAELAASYGADPVDVELVGTTLTALGAQVLSANPATRLVRVSGPAGRLSRIFGTTPRAGHQRGPRAYLYYLEGQPSFARPACPVDDGHPGAITRRHLPPEPDPG